MPLIDRIPGPDNLYVGGIWALGSETQRKALYEANVTHVLSVIKYSFDGWGEEAKRFRHMSIDIDDDEDSDLLVHFSSAVRFIDRALHPSNTPEGQILQSSDENDAGVSPVPPSSNAVYVHCAMGKSRSVSCVIAYILYKYPHRFEGGRSAARPDRQGTAEDAVKRALQLVRDVRSLAEPNDGFMRQLALWWEMGCPVEDDSAVERHPLYQRWLYDKMLKDARYMHVAPEAEQIRFEDEVQDGRDQEQASRQSQEGKEIRCKKCRRILATPTFLIPHTPTGQSASPNCAHIFIDTLSWMRPALEDGALDGRLNCPNTKCGANVGRFAWQGLECNCREWVVPAFSLSRNRVDEVTPRTDAIRMPPGRNGSL
ncbi:dual specificity protein phosphatase 12 [Xylariomycetidae sp. FL2044]|nr:dual specificity protein phosphatase 12 [Xylariomycetidae sp. FL2044]